MHYSTKIHIASLIATVIAFTLFVCAAGALDNFLMFIVLMISVMASAILTLGADHLIKETKAFRIKMNYCYSCGTSLREAATAGICPKCQSELNLLNIIDR